MKQWLVIISILSLIIVMIPTMFVVPFGTSDKTKPVANDRVASTNVLQPVDTDLTVNVYRSDEQTIASIPLEDYIVGVVASEMPALFELEALKAQALTARTYIVKQLQHRADLNLPEGADVTDTVMHQVYRPNDELQSLWKSDYDWKIDKIRKAVKATEGLILTYDDQPITASFFSTSNGYTENAEDYWQSAKPYLKSVASPWDKASPKYRHEKAFSETEFEQHLGVSLPSGNSLGRITRTESQRVDTYEINDQTFSGREVRDKLGLKSSDFTIKRQGNEIIVTTKGYGHGVGLSQYGANGMAKDGKNVVEIISHYYRGVDISTMTPYVDTKVASNQ